MNLQQGIQSRASANEFNRRRFDRDGGPKTENKIPFVKPSSGNSTSTLNGGKGSSAATSPSRDRLIFVSTCLIGLHVEVHVKNGSIFSGIFSSVNAKDFGIVLKMAQLVKDGSVKVQKGAQETNKRPQTIIIPAKEFVQIIAKDVPLSCDEFSTTNSREKRKDLMIDSVISRSHNVEAARELERWTPDEDDPECPELDNIFDGTWNRNWDQFETNETLFGVKSTFNEELYTTKLVRGPQTREIEREASRIAREIEGEETHDLHLAEERGTHFHDDYYDLDEESRYSAVHRQIDEDRFEENDEIFSDSLNTETFDGSANSEFSTTFSSFSQEKKFDEGKTSSTYSSLDADILRNCTSDKGEDSSDANKHYSLLFSDDAKKCLSEDDSSSVRPDISDQLAQYQNENRSSLLEKSVKVSTEAHNLNEDENIDNSSRSSDISPSNKIPDPIELDNLFPASSASCISEQVATASAFNGPTLSSSSSLCSSSSERSTLNPNAKEFKLNPNAKSFTPYTSFRSSVAMSEGSLYFTNAMQTPPPMQSMPIGVGIGPTFAAHQTVYHPQAPQLQSSPYMQANGPMYGAQMIVSQPQPFYYMPSYPPDMQYRGRNF